jgi:HEXXH motif-containing protein
MFAPLVHRVAARAAFLLPRRDARGIRIHFVLAPEKREEYLGRLDKALGLLQDYDSGRFARLSADVRAIVILPVADFAGALNSTTRICLLSGQLLLEDKGGIATATTLAHEAQHARLLQRVIPSPRQQSCGV